MLEWGPGRTAEEQLGIVLGYETKPQDLVALAPLTPSIRDDRPINEYYLIRRWREFRARRMR
jgi:hypothetical protein